MFWSQIPSPPIHPCMYVCVRCSPLQVCVALTPEGMFGAQSWRYVWHSPLQICMCGAHPCRCVWCSSLWVCVVLIPLGMCSAHPWRCVCVVLTPADMCMYHSSWQPQNAFPTHFYLHLMYQYRVFHSNPEIPHLASLASQFVQGILPASISWALGL